MLNSAGNTCKCQWNVQLISYEQLFSTIRMQTSQISLIGFMHMNRVQAQLLPAQTPDLHAIF